MQERKVPETLRLRSVTPSLTASDLEASLGFYRDVLGFVVVETYEEGDTFRGAKLKAGSVHLYLGQDDFAKGRDRLKGAGIRLWCETAQDLDELAANIRQRGGELAEPITERSWGRDFAVVDPDGFKLSFTTAKD